MASDMGFLEQVKFPRVENSWAAILVNLLFWSALWGFDLYGVTTGHTHKITVILSLFIIPVAIVHGYVVVVRKLRRIPGPLPG